MAKPRFRDVGYRIACDRRLLIALILIVAAGRVPLLPEDLEGVVRVDAVQTRVQPDVEVFIPSGIIVQDSRSELGIREIRVRSQFNLYTGSLAASISVGRLEGLVRPSTQIGLVLDSESLVDPLFADTALLTSRGFVRRRRFADPRLDIATGGATIWTSARLVETLELTLAGSDQNRRIDVYPEVGWRFERLRRLFPEASPELAGGSASSRLTLRVDATRYVPVDLRWSTRASIAYRPRERMRIEHALLAETPLVIWDGDISGRVSVGGTDRLRGWEAGSPTGRAVMIAATTLEHTVAGHITTPEEGDIPSVRAHSFRLVAAADGAIYQPERPLLGSVPQAALSFGAGLAFTISESNDRHFDVRALVALPVANPPLPVFYLSTALFAVSASP